MEINKIYNEDCLVTMSNMTDGFVDLTVTSPPYDNVRDYKGFSFDFESVANQLYRVTAVGGIVVWVVSDQTLKGTESGTSFKQALYFKEIGFNLHDTMIFAKTNPPPLTHNRYDPCFEYMFVFSKGKPKTFNPLKEECLGVGKKLNRGNGKKAEGENLYITRIRDEVTTTKEYKYRKNVWYYVVGQGDTGNHPAPFPEKLAEDHILSWSDIGDLVYDPFTGSGTTAKMAMLNGRNYIGSEISAEYCLLTEQRLSSGCISNTDNK